MNKDEKIKMLSFLAAITAQVLENMGDEINQEDFVVLENANNIAWGESMELGANSVKFYEMCKNAERITGFTKP